MFSTFIFFLDPSRWKAEHDCKAVVITRLQSRAEEDVLSQQSVYAKYINSCGIKMIFSTDFLSGDENCILQAYCRKYLWKIDIFKAI